MTIFWSKGIEHIATRYCEECGRILLAEEEKLCNDCQEEGQEAEEYMYWEENECG